MLILVVKLFTFSPLCKEPYLQQEAWKLLCCILYAELDTGDTETKLNIYN